MNPLNITSLVPFELIATNFVATKRFKLAS